MVKREKSTELPPFWNEVKEGGARCFFNEITQCSRAHTRKRKAKHFLFDTPGKILYLLPFPRKIFEKGSHIIQ